jgi:peptidoglycan/xylan/chitin deacetylase (PgdA/CDA1 family)
MLHYVSDDPVYDALKPWNISPTSFTRLLDFLQKENYYTVGFEDLSSSKIKGRKNIIITFDDCPKHLWDFAIPELIRRKMKAVFYMPTAYLGGCNEWNVVEGLPEINLMDDEDIAKLSTVGMEVGSHAHNHVMLQEKDAVEVVAQLTKSKSILEAITNKPVLSVAYPYGSVPQNAYKTAENAGYQYGLAVFTPWQTKYAIRRWVYDDTDTLETIQWKVSKPYNWYRAWHDKKDYYLTKLLRRIYNTYAEIKNSIMRKTILMISFTQYLSSTD